MSYKQGQMATTAMGPNGQRDVEPEKPAIGNNKQTISNTNTPGIATVSPEI
jgi:hypothetical protein